MWPVHAPSPAAATSWLACRLGRDTQPMRCHVFLIFDFCVAFFRTLTSRCTLYAYGRTAKAWRTGFTHPPGSSAHQVLRAFEVATRAVKKWHPPHPGTVDSRPSPTTQDPSEQDFAKSQLGQNGQGRAGHLA